MGCCHSTAGSVTKSPPSEEETVKEVLSETPAAVLNPKAYHPLPRSQVTGPTDSPFIRIAPLLDFSTRGGPKQSAGARNEDHSGEVSEICSSLSGSFAASTENMGTRDQFRERRHRSPAKPARSRSLSGEVKMEKPVGRSPGRRSDPSPSRVAPVSGNGRRRDAGESSGRRSRSPVTRPAKTGPGPARRTGKSPGRVGSGLRERTRKLEDGAGVPGNDPLENPLVSLECFIFL